MLLSESQSQCCFGDHKSSNTFSKYGYSKEWEGNFERKDFKKKHNFSVLGWGEIYIKTIETQQTGEIKDLNNWSVIEVTVLTYSSLTVLPPNPWEFMPQCMNASTLQMQD